MSSLAGLNHDGVSKYFVVSALQYLSTRQSAPDYVLDSDGAVHGAVNVKRQLPSIYMCIFC